jgi:peptidyl-prolyl cis-trans isomerase-like protein 2
MLAKQGKYDDVVFHRLVPGFMVKHIRPSIRVSTSFTPLQIQTGDPTGTGSGGESFWGTPFRDEYDLKGAAKHDERGVLSMANKGKDTNR